MNLNLQNTGPWILDHLRTKSYHKTFVMLTQTENAPVDSCHMASFFNAK